jgi:hypothetical protein
LSQAASFERLDAATLPAGFVSRWSYVPSAPGREIRVERLRARLRRSAFPAHQVLMPIRAAHDVWLVHFVYAPRAVLSRSQRVTLRRLKDLALPLLVVCATPQPQQVPVEIAACADSLLWKDPRGYDISAYTLALHEVARGSPGATVYVSNDSVFGPMTDLRPLIREAPWDLTGLTAHHGDENHLQSYAFVLKGVTPARLEALAPVFTTRWSLAWGDHVVAAQETRLSRLAARSMSVGAYLYAGPPLPGDPMTTRAFEMIEMGHPYLKKSLLGKMHQYQDVERVITFVVEHGLIDDSA